MSVQDLGASSNPPNWFSDDLYARVFKRLLRSSESLKQWFERQTTRACVLHTPCTSVLKSVLPAGRVCGVATHAVGVDAGYACC